MGEKIKFRPLEIAEVKVRQPRHVVHISVENPTIPLKENWSERQYVFPAEMPEYAEQFLNFKVRPDDVFVSTYPKCGTTWMQETVWLLKNGLDFEKGKKICLTERSPLLEASGLYKQNYDEGTKMVDLTPSPRVIKTHLPASMMPTEIWSQKIKTIFVARNVKDCIVSSKYFFSSLGTWKGTMKEYVHDFLNDYLVYSPYLPRLLDCWKLRNEPNVFFTTYEEMQRDLAGIIKKLCTFLERPQLTELELQELLDHLSFDKMKQNKKADFGQALKEHLNRDVLFMRRGVVGSYKEDLTPEQIARIDSWSSAYFAKHGLKEEDIFGPLKESSH